MTPILFEELRRLLQYSGKTVKDESVTADGATAVVEMFGEDIRIFVAPVREFMSQSHESELYDVE